MPNTISLLPSSLPQITHDPTATLNGDPMGVMGKNPYGEMTSEILFGAVNMLLGWIDDATGLDLLGLATALEGLLGGPLNLLTGFFGFLTPGSGTAGGGVLGPLLNLIPGLGGGTGTLGGLGSFLNPTSLLSGGGIFGPLLDLIPGLGGGAGTLGGLGAFLNPTTFLGAAAGIFAPLLSGGTLLGGLIPGLDASKIVSGTLGASIVQPLIDAVSQGFGGSTGLGFGGLFSFLNGLSFSGGGIGFNDLLALIPGLAGGLTGSTGLGSVFTDLFGLLGNPTSVGGGSPGLPGIGSIPILGGLLSGGNILGSLIPGLDASKIISGFFPLSMITGLLSGGTILTSLIPGLDAGKIVSGLFPLGMITGLIDPSSGSIFSNFLGLIPAGLLPQMGIGNLTTAPSELLKYPMFDDPAEIVGQGIWSQDGTKTVPGATKPGSVTVMANGVANTLYSNIIQVVPGDKVTQYISTMWTGLVSTGSPIQLIAKVYDSAQTIIDTPILASVASPGASGAWQQISGSYTVPVGATHMTMALRVLGTATAGQVWFGKGSYTKSNQIPGGNVLGLGGVGTIVGDLQHMGDSIFGGLTGGTSGGNLFTDISNALSAISFANILGTGGPANIGGSMQETWNQFVGGLVGLAGTGAGLSDLYSVGQAVSSSASRGAMAFDIAGIRGNKALRTGFLPSSQSNITLDKLSLNASLPTVPITQATALTNYERIGEAIDIGAVSWQGSGTANVTDCYINIYKMDPVTGVNTLVHSSTNQVGLLSATMAPVVYTLPTPVHFDPTEIFGMEISIRGTGTHNMVGNVSSLVDQTVYPRRWSSVRDSGTSAPPSSFTPTYGSNVGFIEFAVSASTVPIPHSPSTVLVNTVGTTSVPVPAWANYVDRIACGGGGGGHQGGTWGVYGTGGDNGNWNADTRSRASGHFTDGQSVSVTIPAAAAGGGGNGANGGSVTAALNSNTLTATGGPGATTFEGGMTGQSPGDYTYNSIVYPGGKAQSSFGGNGPAPGSGGAGGNYVSFQSGGKGGIGYCWLVFRQ